MCWCIFDMVRTWAEITLRQHHLWPSQCFVLIKPVELKMGSKKGYICVSITVDGWWYQFLGVISSESVLTVGFPLSAPVLSWLFIARGKAYASPGRPKSYQNSPQREPQSVPAATNSFQGLLGPTLRANPFPEVTDLFCRLPCSCKRGEWERDWVRHWFVCINDVSRWIFHVKRTLSTLFYH